jgi:hypothetical protein
MGFSTRVACLHPGWLTALPFICLFGGSWLAMLIPPQTLLALPLVISLIPLLWMLGLYRIAGLAVRDVTRASNGHDWIFWLTGAAQLAAAAIFMIDGETILATMHLPPVVYLPVSVWVIGLIAAMGLAAFNLSAFDRGEAPSAGAVAGTFALLWFWPIGVWVLRPVVRRLRLALDHTPTGAAVQG